MSALLWLFAGLVVGVFKMWCISGLLNAFCVSLLFKAVLRINPIFKVILVEPSSCYFHVLHVIFIFVS